MKYRTALLKEQAKDQVSQEIMARGIHKALAGQLKPDDSEIVEKLRKESKRYETIQFRLQAN